MVGLSAQQVVTTEGTEYWLTFLNNAKWDPQDDLNDGKKFELELVVTARQATQVRVELRGAVIATLNVPAGGTAEQSLVNWQKQIYLLESQNANLYQGLRVYTEDKNTPFTCYTYTRTGDPGISLRDIAMVYPVDLLDKEYFIQTYPDDDYSTQLAFVVTEDNTDVQVFPTYLTLQQTPLAWTNLRKGTAVLVASAPHQGTNSSVGLSGTRVCASKPIAVFNGNQATKSPYDGAYSSGYMVEQTLPIVQWGTKFYLALLGNTKSNSYVITAAYDNTEFQMLGYDEDLDQVVTQTVTLNRGESIDPNLLDEYVKQDVIITSKPALCYVYTTAAAANYFRPNNMGNSCSAMLPAWEHRIKSMPFITKKLDPLNLNSEKHFIYVVTPTADTDKLTLDGQPVAASAFTPFTSDPSMSFASLRVSVDNGHGHLLETTGEGFVGMVYDIAAAQANFYTLGFHYLPYQDSLFVTNTEDVMSPTSYGLARMNQGWYQRQNDEFPADQNRLDTAVICENTTLNWLVQTYIQGNTSPVVWELYDVSDDSGIPNLIDTYRDESPATTTMHRWQHLFVLPEEKDLEPGNREPYRLFRLDAILHKAHTICTSLEDELDTLQMVVRVNRVYNDTVHRVICLGDEFRFFYDNMDCQGNLAHQVPQQEITSFVGDKTAGDSATPFSWKARLGQNLFTRRYQTINGCDSISTLDLFVCDTFRIVDTIHICDNQRITWQHNTYAGTKYKGRSTHVVQDSAVFEAPYKTRWCPCMENDQYPAFVGCDSTYELHLYVHPTYQDTIEAEMCINGDSAQAYLWDIHEGADQLAITIKNPTMKQADGYWDGYFHDSLKTKTCPDCTNGLGCDSVRVLHIVIPDSYYFEETVDFCGAHYDYDLLSMVSDAYVWSGHPNGAHLTQSGDYYDSCHTVAGCDSIYHLALSVHSPYLYIDRHTMPNNQTYTWHGQTYGPFPDTWNDTTLYFYDRQATSTSFGCDSIVRLDLKIAQTFLITEEREICDGDSVLWRGKKIVSAGYDFSSEGFTPDVICTTSSVIVYDSLLTVTFPQRDSVYQLNLTIRPVYALYDTLHICDNASVLWQGRLYQGANASDDGTAYWTKPQGEYDDVRAWQSEYGCDSIYYLHLIVKPTYAFAVEDAAVCQDAPFEWNEHNGHTLYCVETGRYVSSISTSSAGVFTYLDSLKTHSCADCGSGCDSVYTLRLQVYSTYYFHDTLTICEGDSVEWQRHYRLGKDTARTESTDYFGDRMYVTTDYTVSYQTHSGCDSIYNLHLIVRPRKHTHIDYAMCDYEDYDFNGKPYHRPAAGTYLDTVHLQTAYSCDSVVTLRLVVHPSYTYTKQDTICASEAPYLITYGTKTYSFSQTTDTILLTPSSAACDSALHLRLQVNPTYYFHDTLTICEGDSVEWQNLYRLGKDTARMESTDYFGDRMYVTTDYTVSYQTHSGCDSIYNLHLIVRPRKHTHIDYAMCDYEDYDFNGKPYHRPAAGTYLDTIHLQTAHSCDSVVTLRLIVHPSYTYTKQDTICASEAPYLITYGTKTYSFSQTIDTILLTPSSAACDSALHLQLQVNPTYYFHDTLTICEGDSVEWQSQYRHGKDTARMESTDYFGDRMYVTTDYTVSYQTHLGCDSIYNLHLIVNPRKHTHIDYAMCDYEDYDFNGKPYHRPAAGTYLDTVHLQTAYSCDSVVTLRLVVHPSYHFVQTTTVCQDTLNPDWLWIDADGQSHGTISIADSGSYYILDKYQTIYGCDSIYGIHLRVNPIYRFDSVYTICQNERISWQNKWYCGSHTQSQLTIRPASEPEQHIDSLTYSFLPGDSVLSAGWHYDTAHYYTIDGCDSTYYLSLYVKPTYDTVLNVDICDNSEVYLFRTADAHGHHYIDSIAISPITRYLPSGAKDTAFITRTRRLTTVEGCDSVVYLHLTVHPTYEFRTTAEICFGSYYEWRGRFYNATGIYFDNQPTQGWGCDSLYILELYVKPAVIVPLYRSICNNETFVHTDTLWYTNGNHSEVNTLVWKPGMTIPQTYTDVIFKGADGCDSIIYRYFLTIHDTYYSEETTTLCSNETYLSPESDHYWPGLQTEYGMGQSMPSIDTTFVDSLTSVYGCDSVFVLHARIHPAYRNIEYDTICGNTEWQWHNHHYLSLSAGEYTYFDSLTTRLGCDSLYEMRLTVYPSYFFETHDTICANNTYLFNDRSLNQTGFYYDSLTTVHFCDSVYHLYLTVLDTTAEFIIDTICTADTIYLHDRPITESGFYKDTTTNIYGCNHYTYLSLTKIPPTVPTAWADSLCADDKAYSLSVSYTGELPIAYSLYYDDFGHEQGFVDQENIPIDNLSPASRTLTLTVPMPDNGGDPLRYPRPDHYPVRLVLDNGLCRNLSYCACDTSLVFSYPSWLTRQRFRDVIAILSPEFNGGYSFDRYQWYKDDTLLVGETREYLYIPRGLEVDASYYVRLTRQGETESYQTCPIIIFPDAQDTIAPTMGYLSVVPTYVVQGHPMVSILSRHEGQYTVHTSAGKVIDSGTFTPDVTEVWLPAVSGVYIFQLVSEQTPEEPKRTIKVIVGDE